MERGEQEPRRDADGFVDVVVLFVPRVAVLLRKYDDQRGRGFEERFMFVGAERGEVAEPALGRAVVIVLVLFLFGGDANLLLDIRVGDEHKSPRLFVGSRWGLRGGLDAVDNGFPGDGFVAVVTHRAALTEFFEEAL